MTPTRPWASAPRKRQQKKTEHRHTYATVRWHNLRKLILNQDPYCQVNRRCGRYYKAVDIDHIIPISCGGHPTSLQNLQGLTKLTHTIKTNLEIRHPDHCLYQHEDGIPVRVNGKLVTTGKPLIYINIGIDRKILNDWSRVYQDLEKIPEWADYSIECRGYEQGLIKLLFDQRYSFYIRRYDPAGIEFENNHEYNRTKVIPCDEIVMT